MDALRSAWEDDMAWEELDHLRARIASLESERDRLREALGSVVRSTPYYIEPTMGRLCIICGKREHDVSCPWPAARQALEETGREG